MGRSRYKFTKANSPHFMTCTASSPEGIALDSGFHPPGTATILLDSLRFLIKDGMKLYACVILENHIHLIAQSERLAYAFPRRSVGTRKDIVGLACEHKKKRGSANASICFSGDYFAYIV
jgi:hypothetical protein